MNWDLDLLAVLLVSNNLLNVDAPSSSVHGQHLAGLALDSAVGTSALDHNDVSLSHWDGSGFVFVSKFLAQVAAHDLSSDAAGGGEVSLSGLSSLAGNTYK